MRRYTTPTLVITIDKPELIDTSGIYVTFAQGAQLLTINSDIDVTATETGVQLELELTQLQTAGFVPGRAQLQVNWLESNGNRGATEIATINITDNLLNQVIPGQDPEA